MRVAVFSAKAHDREFLTRANEAGEHVLEFFEPRLTAATVPLATGFPAVCAFVNDELDAPVIEGLARGGLRVIALRCAGFNNVDLTAAEQAGVTVVRVPAYSPHAVAEHTVGLILALNRGLHRAHQRVREGDFSLEGLMGFDLAGRTAGIIGTGQIGRIVARVLHAFGCRVLAMDPKEDPDCVSLGVEYVSQETLLSESDIVTLHCPLTPETHHLIDAGAVERMNPGVMLINTSRGAIVDTDAVIAGLKSRRIGYLGIDVYEEEADLFFQDLSNEVIQDDVFARLLTFPNVLITGHQAFFTRDALQDIAETTIANLSDVQGGGACRNEVGADLVV